MPVYTSTLRPPNGAFPEHIAGLLQLARDIVMYSNYITSDEAPQEARNTANHARASVQWGVCAKPASRNRRAKPSIVYL